ncbi:synaptogenesis protein syg-2-like [Schistocerca serialis cubense]|uniref:synaptogenesis protein syg-2-like n=1 Tax=Schistocerca serialis cubense TaxID=2023355 RepID=UPI00214F0A88|nr:synaptogenesis protein syg-2-like [Schistocerca serialis cubense]
MGQPQQSLDTVLAVSTVILLLFASAGIVSAQGRVKQVRAVINGTAQLPCDMTPPTPGDSVLLVIWFKNEKTAIYSYDARRKSWEGPSGPHWKHPQLLGERGFFRTVATPAALSLSDVAESDEGVYRCRVDFRRSASRIQRVRLTVIVPPQRPKIYDERGVEVGPVAGPYQEGGQARLTCVVYGGRPPPEIRWWRGERLLESRELPAGPRIRERLLLLPRLSRADLHATLTCQAVNSNLTLPAEARVSLDINFRPLSTTILSSEQPLTAGRRYEIACRTVGSRPPAVVSWWLDNTRLPASTDKVSADGNETISTLSLTPEYTDDGRLLTCRAENPQVLGGIEEHSVRLAVYYAPSTELRLGPRLHADNVEEGSDVYFECHVRANPPAYKVYWKFEGKTLVQNHTGGVIMTRGALALQSVSRKNAGDYSCVASNVEGDGESPPLRLRIKYKPVCRPGQRRVYAVARHEVAHVRCEVEAFPEAVGFRWAFNNSAETLDVPQSRFNWSAGASQLAHAPVNDMDYGSVLCWADNSVGQQRRPCVFHIVPAGQPDVPTNCSVLNQTSQSVVVRCTPGFDGGQPQSFLLEVLEAANGHQLFNMTQLRPHFVVDGLAAGQLLQLRISAVNAKGRSDSVTLDAATLMPPEMRASKYQDVAAGCCSNASCVSSVLLLCAVTV